MLSTKLETERLMKDTFDPLIGENPSKCGSQVETQCWWIPKIVQCKKEVKLGRRSSKV